MFEVAVFVVAVAAGAVASVAGFGIGSLLTPLLAVSLPTKVAVAAVAIPHVLGTALRFWLLRGHVDRRVLVSFGLASAAGGLAGALLHDLAANRWLTLIFGLLLVFAGATGVTGVASRMRFRGWLAWAAGALSGLFGGLVGNQGGIRSAALMGFPLERDAFVATATAIALLVDGARLPVYLAAEWSPLWRSRELIGLAVAGVLAGTVAGGRVLHRIPETIFRRAVAAIILILGVWMLARS